MLNEEQKLRKMLIFRGSHRGLKEMDLLLGGFAQKHVPTMSKSEMRDFQRILALPDQELLAWYMGSESVPAHKFSPLLSQILKFKIQQ